MFFFSGDVSGSRLRTDCWLVLDFSLPLVRFSCIFRLNLTLHNLKYSESTAAIAVTPNAFLCACKFSPLFRNHRAVKPSIKLTYLLLGIDGRPAPEYGDSIHNIAIPHRQTSPHSSNHSPPSHHHSTEPTSSTHHIAHEVVQASLGRRKREKEKKSYRGLNLDGEKDGDRTFLLGGKEGREEVDYSLSPRNSLRHSVSPSSQDVNTRECLINQFV